MHQCPVCSKSFPSPFKLQRHYVIHTGQKPFTCDICGKAFTQSGHLKAHLQKVHRSTPPTDHPREGILTQNQQADYDKPAARNNTQGSVNYTLLSSAASPSVVCWSEKERSFFSSSSEATNPTKHVPCVNDLMAPGSSVMDAVSKEEADPGNVDTSVCRDQNGYTCRVCLKSFTSYLQLWIHSPSHNKAKQSDRGRESAQTFSKKTQLKALQRSQELRSSRSKVSLKHQCPKCLKTFCSPSKLQRHFLIHTGQKPYSCSICWKAFTQKVHLKSHLRTASQCSLSLATERKKQTFCNDRQTSGLEPQSSPHQQPTIHHTHVNPSEELELECKISVNGMQDINVAEMGSDAVIKQEKPLNESSRCQSTCRKSDEQEQQHSMHTDLKPFQCVVCNRSFRLEINLMRHHKSHRNQKELGLVSLQNSDYVKMSHSEVIKQSPKPSGADQVDSNFTVKAETWSEHSSNLNDFLPQELTSSAEQQRETCRATSKQQRMNTLHQCHSCLKCFPSASKLQRHMMTHTGQRPFGCEMCGKRFRQKTHLRVHCRTHLWSRYHKQRSLYINRPPSRSGGFNTKTAADVTVQEMLIHRKDFDTHTSSDVVSVKHLAQTPSMVIIQNANRESDKKLLPHTTKENEAEQMRKVSKVTVKKTQATKFRKNPGNTQNKCLRCLKCFPSVSKLQRHEMVHTGLKPFQCFLCGKAFRQASHLKTHQRTHSERKPSQPSDQQGNIRKQKTGNQQCLYPRISVRKPTQERSVTTDSTLSHSDGAVSNGVTLKSGVGCKKRKLHTCQICFKNFAFPYKLSRHLVTHTGMRLYKCTLCSKTFTQRGHLNLHELRCGEGDRISHYVQGEVMNTNHVHDKHNESLADCIDFNVSATRKSLESDYNGAGDFSFPAADLSCSEAAHTEWQAVPGAGSQEEKNESEKRQRENGNQPIDNYSYSFPTQLAFEIKKIIQSQNMAAPPLSHQYEVDAQNLEVPCQLKEVPVISESNELPSDELGSPELESQMQPYDYWCEPLTAFECDKCSTSLLSKNELGQHICSTDVQHKTAESVQRYRCDICFKHFVSPSKLKRHYLIHTGQRPFRCDICGKTFTQSVHARIHRRTH